MSNELILVDIDLAGNALIRASLEALAAAPGTALPRQMYYDTTLDCPRVRNKDNTAWITLDPTKLTGVIPNAALATNPLARANHTGTQTASTISNFDTQVRTNRLDQLATPTADVSLANNRLTNVADPVNNTDAANKQWVMGQVQASAAGIDARPSVRFSTTGNIALSGLLIQGGGDWPANMAENDQVLVKNQTNAAENGIYVAHAGAWTRRSDAGSGSSLTTGALVIIEEGTLHSMTGWILSTYNPIIVGTTNLVWNRYTTSTVYTAGDSININDNKIYVLSVVNGGITVNPGGLSVDATVARTTSAPGTIIGDGTTTTFNVTHNQNKRGFPVFIAQSSTPFSLVRPGIQYDTLNTFKVIFNVAPANGTNYTVDWVS